MTTPAFELHLSPLVDLLDQEFSAAELEQRLGSAVARVHPRHVERALYEPARYFLSRPGKQFRARLVELTWQMSGGLGPAPERLGNIVEVLHAGSLIVDDIEDESPMRRGQPALHVAYGLPIALNSGNWLYFWAYSLVERLELRPAIELSLYRWLGRTLTRCHVGQSLDLTVRLSQLGQSEVPALVETTTRLKTGALMGLASALPAISAGASHQMASAFQEFGENLGIGLQMLDDLGAVTSRTRCHKGHEDLRHDRPTWVWAWLAQKAPEMTYLRLQQMAREVEAHELHPELLADHLRRALGPEVKLRIRAHLMQAVQLLSRGLGSAHQANELKNEIERLMRSYD